MSKPIKICNGDFEAHIAPALGGSLLSFREKTTDGWFDWLRPAPANCSDILQTACYPLVPFSNRISHGQFNWRSRSITLPANFPPEPHAIHGHGWQSAWDISDNSSDRVAMVMHHDAGDWPWEYQAHQEIMIDDGGLSIVLSLINKSIEPMPAGLGLHPFFPRTDKARIKASVGAIHLNGTDGLPNKIQTQHPAIKAFADGGTIIDGLDNAFADWRGAALIEWPDIGKSLNIIADDTLRHLVVYTPEGDDFFCIEPVSHLNGAFAHNSDEAATSDGLVELGQGEEIKAKITFRSF